MFRKMNSGIKPKYFKASKYLQITVQFGRAFITKYITQTIYLNYVNTGKVTNI